MLVVKNRFLKFCLKILGLTGILFIMESCYGAPSAYYIKQPLDTDKANATNILISDSVSVRIN